MTRTPARRPAAAGFTLVEVMVVVVLIGILSTVAALSFPRAVEQARADLAAANLRSIQAALRYCKAYGVDSRGSIAHVRDALKLIDRGIIAPGEDALIAAHDPSYLYEIVSADPPVARAVRRSGSAVSGQDALEIDEHGYVSGSIRMQAYGPGTPSIRAARIFTHQDQ